MAMYQDAEENPDIPLNEIRTELIEDSYGYVDPYGHSHKISKDVMMQLPSHHLGGYDLMDSGAYTSYGTQKRRRSLKRSETRYKTMKLRRVAVRSADVDNDVEKVYELLTSDPTAEEESITSNLRELHQSLTLKRMVKAKIDSQHDDKIRLHKLSCCSRLKYSIAMSWQHFKYSISDLLYSFELWQGHIKKIQGHFGSGVASYFIFLRWLLCLNFFNFFISFGFIVTPQLIYQNTGNYIFPNNEMNITFNGFDLLTGSGWLGNSSFFYGHYTNETIEVVEGYQYNMPLAYLFVVGMAAIINLIVVAYSVTKSYQNIYIDSTGPLKNKLCGKIFCAWDYGIEKTDTAILRHHLIYIELKELMASELKAHANESCIKTSIKIAFSILVNVFIVCVTICIGYLVYYILEKKAVEVETRVLKNMTLALTVTTISLVFHHLICYATKCEFFFSKHLQLYLTLGRVAALRIVILSVLVYFWIVVPGPRGNWCYESLLGEEIYRLIIVNFFMNLAVCTFFGEFLFKVISRVLGSKCSFIRSPEFDVAYSINDLIYYQTLVWVGAFYSPMLPLLFLVILVVLFYIKVCSVILNCRPSQEPWSATQAQTVFLVLTLMNLLFTGIAIAYIIFRVTPSPTCGPFRTQPTTYAAIADWFQYAQNHSKFIIMLYKYASSPGLPVSIVLALCVAVHYARAYALVNEKIVKRVQEQLILESKDKVFLLHLFDNAYREWKKQQKLQSSQYESGDNNWEKEGANNVEVHESGDFPHEIRNQAFTDYNLRESSPVSPLITNNHGYLLADVPAADRSARTKRCFFPSSSDDDDRSSFAFKDEFRGRLNSHSSATASPLTPSRPQVDVIQRPAHKQGFQYHLRGESPARV